jgi:hypothetical protein
MLTEIDLGRRPRRFIAPGIMAAVEGAGMSPVQRELKNPSQIGETR